MRFLAALILTLALVPSAAAAPLPNACTLVPDAQFTSALGPKVEHNAPPATNGARMCVWQTPFSVSPYRGVTITVFPLAREKFTAKWSRKLAGVKPVHGVAEMAYSIDGGNFLVAWSRGIQITVNTTELKAPLETASRVAKVALSHL